MKGMKRERRQGNGKEWSRRMMWGRRGGKGKENGGRESETSRRIREGRSKAQENLEERKCGTYTTKIFQEKAQCCPHLTSSEAHLHPGKHFPFHY